MGKAINTFNKYRGKIRNVYASATGLVTANMLMTMTAYADNNMLAKVQDLLSKAMMFGGGAIAIWGGVSLGIALWQHGGGGGGQMSQAIFTLAAGGVIFLCGLWFASLDVNWG